MGDQPPIFQPDFPISAPDPNASADMNTMMPPDPGMMGPPDPGMIGPPDPGMMGPPDPGMIGPPDPGMIGPPDPGMIGPPDPGMSSIAGSPLDAAATGLQSAPDAATSFPGDLTAALPPPDDPRTPGPWAEGFVPPDPPTPPDPRTVAQPADYVPPAPPDDPKTPGPWAEGYVFPDPPTLPDKSSPDTPTSFTGDAEGGMSGAGPGGAPYSGVGSTPMASSQSAPSAAEQAALISAQRIPANDAIESDPVGQTLASIPIIIASTMGVAAAGGATLEELAAHAVKEGLESYVAEKLVPEKLAPEPSPTASHGEIVGVDSTPELDPIDAGPDGTRSGKGE